MISDDHPDFPSWQVWLLVVSTLVWFISMPCIIYDLLTGGKWFAERGLGLLNFASGVGMFVGFNRAKAYHKKWHAKRDEMEQDEADRLIMLYRLTGALRAQVVDANGLVIDELELRIDPSDANTLQAVYKATSTCTVAGLNFGIGYRHKVNLEKPRNLMNGDTIHVAVHVDQGIEASI